MLRSISDARCSTALPQDPQEQQQHQKEIDLGLIGIVVGSLPQTGTIVQERERSEIPYRDCERARAGPSLLSSLLAPAHPSRYYDRSAVSHTMIFRRYFLFDIHVIRPVKHRSCGVADTSSTSREGCRRAHSHRGGASAQDKRWDMSERDSRGTFHGWSHQCLMLCMSLLICCSRCYSVKLFDYR